jgi:site-specific DNA-methyltransferase (adenine-specific)
MPEQLLGRIIRACSNEGELVLDPFGGSGTTLAVAKKLARQFVGYELSDEYAKQINERLSRVKVGDALDGAPEPIVSAPSTAEGRRLEDVDSPKKRKRIVQRKVANSATSNSQQNLPGIES